MNEELWEELRASLKQWIELHTSDLLRVVDTERKFDIPVIEDFSLVISFEDGRDENLQALMEIGSRASTYRSRGLHHEILRILDRGGD